MVSPSPPRLVRRFEEQRALVRIPLRIVDLLRRPIAATGVDFPLFRRILQVRLTLDLRRGGSEAARGGPFGQGLVATYLMNLLLGSFAGIFFVFFRHTPGLALGMVLLVVMTFLTMILLVDYSPSLLDTTDLRIVAPTPVEDGTVYAARVAHAVVYLAFAAGSLALPAAVFGCFVFPPWIFLPVYGISVALAAIWCLSVAFGLFVIAVRVFDLERLRDALLYVQIVATVAVMVGYQVVPRLATMVDLPGAIGSHPMLRALFPPMHYGGLLEAALGAHTVPNLALSILAVTLPLTLLAGTVRLARGRFVSGLAALAEGGHSAPARRRRRFRWGLLFARTREARAGHDFLAALSRRERPFRLRVYPIVAMTLVIGFVIALSGGSLRSPSLLCGAIYMMGMCAPTVVLVSRYSEDSAAAWLFDAAPLARRSEFLRGAMTALITTLVVPVFLLITAVVVAVGGAGVLLDAAMAFSAGLCLSLGAVVTLGGAMPFTEEPQKNPSEGNMGFVMVYMLLTGIVVLVHMVARLHPVGVVLYLTGCAVVLVLELRAFRNLAGERR